MPRYAETDAFYIELASERKIRERNTLTYRVLHWPLWIFAFAIAPGPLTVELFAGGSDPRMLAWLSLVLVGTGIAALRGALPGCEPGPYVVRFTEDLPNPLYRRVCYTTAWGNVVGFAMLNLAGLTYAVLTGEWRLRETYQTMYFPIVATVWAAGAWGILPRAKQSTRHEGHERRYFYGSVWAVALAQPVLWILWKVLPAGRPADVVKFGAFVGIVVVAGLLAWRGILPRTRPIMAGALALD